MRTEITLKPLGGAWIWDCPFCEYTQGPVEEPVDNLTCGDCGTTWTLADCLPMSLRVWSQVGRLPIRDPRVDIAFEGEDDNKQMHVTLELDPREMEGLPPKPVDLLYEAAIYKDRLLTLEED